MSSFRLYNIQLLPLDTNITQEVGVEGYRKLFYELEVVRKAAHLSKTVVDYSYQLPHDTYFTAFAIFPRIKFAEENGSNIKRQRA